LDVLKMEKLDSLFTVYILNQLPADSFREDDTTTHHDSGRGRGAGSGYGHRLSVANLTTSKSRAGNSISILQARKGLTMRFCQFVGALCHCAKIAFGKHPFSPHTSSIIEKFCLLLLKMSNSPLAYELGKPFRLLSGIAPTLILYLERHVAAEKKKNVPWNKHLQKCRAAYLRKSQGPSSRYFQGFTDDADGTGAGPAEGRSLKGSEVGSVFQECSEHDFQKNGGGRNSAWSPAGPKNEDDEVRRHLEDLMSGHLSNFKEEAAANVAPPSLVPNFNFASTTLEQPELNLETSGLQSQSFPGLIVTSKSRKGQFKVTPRKDELGPHVNMPPEVSVHDPYASPRQEEDAGGGGGKGATTTGAQLRHNTLDWFRESDETNMASPQKGGSGGPREATSAEEDDAEHAELLRQIAESRRNSMETSPPSNSEGGGLPRGPLPSQDASAQHRSYGLQKTDSRVQRIHKSRLDRRVTTAHSTSLSEGLVGARSSTLSRFSQASKQGFRQRLATRDGVFVPSLKPPPPPKPVQEANQKSTTQTAAAPAHVQPAAGHSGSGSTSNNQNIDTAGMMEVRPPAIQTQAGPLAKGSQDKQSLGQVPQQSGATVAAGDSNGRRRGTIGRSDSNMSENQDDDANVSGELVPPNSTITECPPPPTTTTTTSTLPRPSRPPLFPTFSAFSTKRVVFSWGRGEEFSQQSRVKSKARDLSFLFIVILGPFGDLLMSNSTTLRGPAAATFKKFVPRSRRQPASAGNVSNGSSDSQAQGLVRTHEGSIASSTAGVAENPAVVEARAVANKIFARQQANKLSAAGEGKSVSEEKVLVGESSDNAAGSF
jgi:hypothetical protein